MEHTLTDLPDVGMPQREAMNGILDLPPIDRPSFMMSGTCGVTRWVTYDDRNEDDEDAEQPLKRRSFSHSVKLAALLQNSGATNNEGAAANETNQTPVEQAAPMPPARPVAVKFADGNAQPQEDSELLEARAKRDSAEKAIRDRNSGASALWVEKYKARTFVDLLSNEEINLKALKWLKAWEPCVQGQEDPPQERILLLSGPPGVGKSTLASILVAHCGYDVVEVNASVDRTVKVIDDVIKTVVTNISTGGANNVQLTVSHGENSATAALQRPKCLILDEVDGITTNVIHLLLQKDIQRPVICMCNNLYVPSLRALRQSTMVASFAMPAIEYQQLSARLKWILGREGKRVEMPALTELCISSEGDIRTCLNRLQFLCTQLDERGVGKTAVTMQLIGSLKGKDTSVSAFSLWNDTFKKKERSRYSAPPRGHPASAEQQQSDGTPGIRLDSGYQHILQQAGRCSDDSLLVEGLHQHYLKQPYVDFDMRRTTAITEWGAFYDQLVAEGFRTQTFLHHRYTDVMCANVFLRCSSTRRPVDITYPRERQLLSTAIMASKEIVEDFLRPTERIASGSAAPHNPASSVALPVYYTSDAATMDLCPSLVETLPPMVRLHPAVQVSNLPEADQTMLSDCIDRHLAYGVTYRGETRRAQRKRGRDSGQQDGKPGGPPDKNQTVEVMSMAPDLEKLAIFRRTGLEGYQRPKNYQQQQQQQKQQQQQAGSGGQKYRSSRRGNTTSFIRGHLATQISNRKVATAVADRNNAAGTTPQPARRKTPPPQSEVAAPAPYVKRDIFGRPVAPKGSLATSTSKAGTTKESDTVCKVRYQFAEGSTSGIRRNAVMTDFV